MTGRRSRILAPRTVLGLELADGRIAHVEATPIRADRDAGAGDRTTRRVRRRTDARRLAGPLRASSGEQTKPMIRTAIVDDQAIVRAGLARILSPADGFEVVAEFADG